jgi:ferredoxin
MRINSDTCLDCGECIPYCPVGAIYSTDYGYGIINLDECVECGVCLRNADCPSDSFEETENPWPRSVRAFFSDPLKEHKETRIPGRGTEEMKTNDVTGRYLYGEAGKACEVGRPGTGTSFRDVQILTMALAAIGIKFEPQNPLTKLMVDEENGLINPEVLDEKVLSAIVEFKVKIEQVPYVLQCLQNVQGQLNTVFSLDLICKVMPDGSIPVLPIMEKVGIPVSLNGKHNVGLGKPYFVENLK